MLTQAIISSSNLIIESSAAPTMIAIVTSFLIAMAIYALGFVVMTILEKNNPEKDYNKGLVSTILTVINIVVIITFTMHGHGDSRKLYEANVVNVKEWAQDNYNLELNDKHAEGLISEGTSLMKVNGEVAKVALSKLDERYYLLVNGVELNTGKRA